MAKGDTCIQYETDTPWIVKTGPCAYTGPFKSFDEAYSFACDNEGVACPLVLPVGIRLLLETGNTSRRQT